MSWAWSRLPRLLEFKECLDNAISLRVLISIKKMVVVAGGVFTDPYWISSNSSWSMILTILLRIERVL